MARRGEPAQPARSRWRLLERFETTALLEVDLDTGRQHQVRIHLAHIGLPILGDLRYGWNPEKHSPVHPRRPLLHALRLGFVHPLTGRRVDAESPLPEDFQAAMKALRRGAQGARPHRRPRSGAV